MAVITAVITALRLTAETLRHYFIYSRKEGAIKGIFVGFSSRKLPEQHCKLIVFFGTSFSVIFGHKELLWPNVTLMAENYLTAVIAVSAVLRHFIANSYGFGVSAKNPFRSHTIIFPCHQVGKCPLNFFMDMCGKINVSIGF